jgi:hypothetical protein
MAKQQFVVACALGAVGVTPCRRDKLRITLVEAWQRFQLGSGPKHFYADHSAY